MAKKITLYKKEQCPLCDVANDLLMLFQDDFDFEVEEVDIYKDDNLLEKYQLAIPVFKAGEDELDCSQMEYEQVQAFLEKVC